MNQPVLLLQGPVGHLTVREQKSEEIWRKLRKKREALRGQGRTASYVALAWGMNLAAITQLLVVGLLQLLGWPFMKLRSVWSFMVSIIAV